VNKDDFEALLTAIGKGAETRVQFSQYLSSRGRFDESLRVWNTLSESEKKLNQAAGQTMIESLIKAKRFHQAGEVWISGTGVATRAEPGHIIDGSFEENVNLTQGGVFSWQYQSVPQAQANIDSDVARTGGKSFRITFQVRTTLQALNVSQLVLVKPNTEYDLEYYVKT